MTQYETEEQQLEAIKNWWKQNGTAVITGAVLAIGALGGWRGWDWYQETQAGDASDAFAVVQELLQTGDIQSFQKQSESLRTRYSSTPYAVLTALQEAKEQAGNGNLAAAAESLHWVISHSDQVPVQDIARLRLARVLIADHKPDEANTVIDHDFPESYASLVHEIRGDILVAKGEIGQAKQAYDEALESVHARGVEFLKMKRDDLGS